VPGVHRQRFDPHFAICFHRASLYCICLAPSRRRRDGAVAASLCRREEETAIRRLPDRCYSAAKKERRSGGCRTVATARDKYLTTPPRERK
jgi:hypothetical protein